MSRQVPTPIVIVFLALKIYSKLDWVIKKNIDMFFKYYSLHVKCAQADPITVFVYFQSYQKSLVTDVPTMSRHVPTGDGVFSSENIFET